MTSQLQTILSELKTRLTELYGERLEKLVLFGSQARGDAEPDSDIDVLVVLKGSVDVGKELWKISEVTSDLCIRYGMVVSTVVASLDEYEETKRPIFEAASREGVAV